MFKLESYITPIILSYVDKYVENVKLQDSQVSLWGGDVTLQNLNLRLHVLENELQLPFAFTSGHVHELNIHVPWTKLTSEPITITINTIECVVRLKTEQSVATGETRDERGGGAVVASTTPSYLQSLVSKIVANINIVCNNVILKYVEEDVVVSVNVKTLTLTSANELWLPEFAEIASNKQIVLRKLIGIVDLTVCLDRRNACGKIDIYQEPILYRCMLDVRLLRVYASRQCTTIKVEVTCDNMEFSLSDTQLPMFERLVYVAMNLPRHRTTTTTTTFVADPQITVEQTDQSTSTWTAWAWNAVTTVLPAIVVDDDFDDEIPCDLRHRSEFASVIKRVSVTFKVSEKQHEKKIQYTPILRASIHDFHSAVTSNCTRDTQTWLNMRASLGSIEIHAVNLCTCGGNVNDGVYFEAHARDISRASVIDMNFEPPIDAWDVHLSRYTDQCLLETNACAMDFVVERLLRDNDDAKQTDDIETNEPRERTLLRFLIGASTTRVTLGLIHRLQTLRNAANAYDYDEPIVWPAAVNEMPPPPSPINDDYPPLRVVEFKCYKPKVQVCVSACRASKDAAIKLIAKCESVVVNVIAPKHPLAVIKSLANVTRAPNKCYARKSILVTAISFLVWTPRGKAAPLTLPFNVNCCERAVLNNGSIDIWRDDVTRDEMDVTCDTIIVMVTKSRVLAATYTVEWIAQLLKQFEVSNLMQPQTPQIEQSDVNCVTFVEIQVDKLNVKRLRTRDTQQLNLNVTSAQAKLLKITDAESPPKELPIFRCCTVTPSVVTAQRFVRATLQTISTRDQLHSTYSLTLNIMPFEMQVHRELGDVLNENVTVCYVLNELRSLANRRSSKGASESSSSGVVDVKKTFTRHDSSVHSFDKSSNVVTIEKTIVTQHNHHHDNGEFFERIFITYRHVIEHCALTVDIGHARVIFPHETLIVQLPHVSVRNTKPNQTPCHVMQQYFPWNVILSNFSVVSSQSSNVIVVEQFSTTITIDLHAKDYDDGGDDEEADDDEIGRQSVTLSACVHLDAGPINMIVCRRRVEIITKAIATVNDILLKPTQGLSKRDDDDDDDTIANVDVASVPLKSSVYESIEEEHCSTTNVSANASDDLRTNTRDKLRDVILFIQSTVARVTMQIHAAAGNDKILKINCEDLIVTLDAHDVYTKVTFKITTCHVTNDESDALDKLLLQVRENVQLHEVRSGETARFVAVTITRARCQNVYNKWGTTKANRQTTSAPPANYITEMIVNMQPMDLIVSPTAFSTFASVFGSSTHASSSTQWTHWNNHTLPLFYLECNHVRMIVPYAATTHAAVVIQFQARVTPNVENPIARTCTIVRRELYDRAMNERTLTVPGADVEDRQYQVNVSGASVAAASWTHCVALIDGCHGKLYTMNENPAFEWNKLRRDGANDDDDDDDGVDGLMPVVCGLELNVIYAPAIVTSQQILVATHAFELNVTSDVDVTLSTTHLKEICEFCARRNTREKSTSGLLDAYEFLLTSGELSVIVYEEGGNVKIPVLYVTLVQINYFQSERMTNFHLYDACVMFASRQTNLDASLPRADAFDVCLFESDRGEPDRVSGVYPAILCVKFSNDTILSDNNSVQVTIARPVLVNVVFDTLLPAIAVALEIFKPLISTNQRGKSSATDGQITIDMKEFTIHILSPHNDVILTVAFDSVTARVLSWQRVDANLRVGGLRISADDFDNNRERFQARNVLSRKNKLPTHPPAAAAAVVGSVRSDRGQVSSNDSGQQIVGGGGVTKRLSSEHFFTPTNSNHAHAIFPENRVPFLNPFTFHVDMTCDKFTAAAATLTIASEYLDVNVTMDLILKLTLWTRGIQLIATRFTELYERVCTRELVDETMSSQLDCTAKIPVGHFKDDLRTGVFQIKAASSSATTFHFVPSPYEIVYTKMRHVVAITWCYPHPRTLIKLCVFPIAIKCLTPHRIRFELESYAFKQYNRIASFTHDNSDMYQLDLSRVFESQPRACSATWRLRVIFDEKNESAMDSHPVDAIAALLIDSIRVDSHFDAQLIPKIDTHVTLGVVKLHLDVIVERMRRRHEQFQFDEYPFDLSNLPGVYNFFEMTFDDLTSRVALYGTSDLIADNSLFVACDASVLCEIIDGGECLNKITVVDSFAFESRVYLDRDSKSVNFDWASQPIQCHVSPAIYQTIENFYEMCTQLLRGTAAIDPICVTRLTKIIIINDCTASLMVRQTNSHDAATLVNAHTAHPYILTTMQPKTLQVKLFGETNTRENRIIWCDPIAMHVETMHVRNLDTHETLTIYVQVTREQNQTIVKVAGQVSVCNWLDTDLEFKLTRADMRERTQVTHLVRKHTVHASILFYKDPSKQYALRVRHVNAQFWSGDIPLRNNNGTPQPPWLVKIPRGHAHFSVWCDVVCENARVLIIFAPLYSIRSFLPFEIDAVAEHASDTCRLRVHGRGVCQQLHLLGTSTDRYRLTFRHVDDERTDTTHVPLDYAQVNQKEFFVRSPTSIASAIADMTRTMKMMMRASTSPHQRGQINWHEFDFTHATHASLMTQMTVNYTKLNAYAPSMLVTLTPWCLIANKTHEPITVTLPASVCVCVNARAIVVPPKFDGIFHLAIGMFQSTALQLLNDTPWTFYAPRVDGHLLADVSARVNIDCQTYVCCLCVKYTRELTRVLHVDASHSFMNNTCVDLYVCGVITHSLQAIAASNCVEFEYVRVQSHARADIMRWNKLNEFDTFDANAAFLYVFIAVSDSTNLRDIRPVRVDRAFVRACINLKSSKPLACVLSCSVSEPKQLNCVSPLLIDAHLDEYAQLLITNESNCAIVCGEFNGVRGERRDILPECEHFDYIVGVDARGDSVYYTMPGLYENFPAVSERKCELLIGVRVRDTIEWSQPIALAEAETYVRTSGDVDLKVTVARNKFTTLVTISNVSHVEFSAGDVRNRLLFGCIHDDDNDVDVVEEQLVITTDTSAHAQDVEPCTSRRETPESNGSWFTARALFENITLIFNDDTRPVVAAYLDNAYVCCAGNMTRAHVSVYAHALQVDNLTYAKETYDFPVIIVGKPQSSKACTHAISLDNMQHWRDYLDASAFMCVRLTLENCLSHVTRIDAQLGHVNVYVEDNYAYCLLAYARMYNGGGKWQHAPERRAVKPVILNEIIIGRVTANLSLHASVKMYVAIDQSPLAFAPFERRNIFTTNYALGQAIAVHYLTGALIEAGWVVGSLELLGNPSGLARNIGHGLADFVNRPYQGMTQGVWGFFGGITSGSVSLMSHITAGTLQSVNKLATSVARNLDRMTLDADHLERMEVIRRSQHQQGFTHGIASGLTSFGVNILGAIGGLAHQPIFSVAHDASATALLTGVSRGILGVFTKSLGGAAGLVALTSHGLLNDTGWSENPEPRNINNDRAPVTSSASLSKLSHLIAHAMDVTPRANCCLSIRFKSTNLMYLIRGRAQIECVRVLFACACTADDSSCNNDQLLDLVPFTHQLIITNVAIVTYDLAREIISHVIWWCDVIDAHVRDECVCVVRKVAERAPESSGQTDHPDDGNVIVEMSRTTRARVAEFIRATTGAQLLDSSAYEPGEIVRFHVDKRTRAHVLTLILLLRKSIMHADVINLEDHVEERSGK